MSCLNSTHITAADRCFSNPTSRILYLRQSKLEGAETLSNLDLLDAVDKKPDRVGPETAEIWSDHGKVVVVAPMPRRPDPKDDAKRHDEAEIAKVMRARLGLTP